MEEKKKTKLEASLEIKQEVHNSSSLIKVFGVARIIDGIFIGDKSVSQNAKFVIQHQVSHVINCAGNELPNEF